MSGNRARKVCPTLHLSPERIETEARVLERVRRSHDRGMGEFHTGVYHEATSSLSWAAGLAFEEGRLFECRGGLWFYRDAEIVRLYARSLFYGAVSQFRAHEAFIIVPMAVYLCTALQAAPDLITSEPPLEDVRQFVEDARRDCVVPGGWHTDHEPRYRDYGAAL